MAATLTTQLTETLAAQARDVQERYPDLYDFIAARDRALRQTLARIPRPGDIESWGAFDLYAHVSQRLLSMPPGLDELAAR